MDSDKNTTTAEILNPANPVARYISYTAPSPSDQLNYRKLRVILPELFQDLLDRFVNVDVSEKSRVIGRLCPLPRVAGRRSFLPLRPKTLRSSLTSSVGEEAGEFRHWRKEIPTVRNGRELSPIKLSQRQPAVVMLDAERRLRGGEWR